ncbi:MAG: twin-arginine translocase TatA/TatE family subunit [Dehalococcoidia bacterium]
MNFFGVGPAEAGLVFVIGLLVVGPQRFPEIMRQAGRWYRVARAYSNEVMKDVRAAVDDIEREVKAETEDLNFAREFSDLKGDLDIKSDLKDAQKAAEAVGKETQAAAGGTTPSIRPSSRKADGAKPADPPASYYQNRAPSTYDPFKAKEAREREAAAQPSPATPPPAITDDGAGSGSSANNGSNGAL